MSEFNIEDLDAVIASAESSLVQLLALQLRGQIRKGEQLAAENVVMIRLLTDISENHVEYYSEGEDGMFAGVPLDYVSEINMYVSRDVNAENPFPATDRIVAGIKADGVEGFIGLLQQCVDDGDFVGDEVAVIVGAIDCGKEFFEHLREGAK